MAFLTFLLFLQIIGLYLFTTGFLLTRLVLDNRSKCDEPPIDLQNTASLFKPGSHETGCWHPKTFSKTVILLIDALRYDFTVPFQPRHQDDVPQHYHDAFTVLYDTAVREPQNAVLLPFIADPPTSTLQRLKGLTTGTLPVFIDIGSNFAGTAIDEDNLIAQMRDANQRVVQLGDDTWHSLFPGYFDPNLTKPFDSFNVWDLHTVDNGVTEHLMPLLQDSEVQSRWDVAIGHFLGVDHAGHRYGPDHQAMASKLRQMDQFITDVIQSLDDETLLIVMGDHGMDSKGDHGGESDDEVEAALWMYSKKGIFGRMPGSPLEPPLTAKERPVAQIDLVPTLALLLGLPIPFNNLGAPIKEAFVGAKGLNAENLARVSRITAAQMHRYMGEYARIRGLDASATTEPASLWSTAQRYWLSAASAKTQLGSGWWSTFLAFSTYQQRTLAICRSLWARFDLLSMAHGVGILAASLVLSLMYARGIHGDLGDATGSLLIKGMSGSTAGAVLGFVSTQVIDSELSFINRLAFATALGGILSTAYGFLSIRTHLRIPLPTSIWSITAVLFTILLSVGFASNSYTIWEDEITLFLLTSLGFLLFTCSLRQAKTADRALGAYHSILFVILGRIASFSRLCREEQMPYCRSTFYASANASTSATWQLAIPIAVAISLPSFIRSYYDATKSYHGTAVFWISSVFRLGLGVVAAYWVLDAADNNEDVQFKGKEYIATVKTYMAQFSLAVALAAGSAMLIYSAPFVKLEKHDVQEAPPVVAKSPASTNGSLRKQLLNKTLPKPAPPVPGFMAADGKSRVTIQGYGNVFGSRHAILLTIWALASMQLSKPMAIGALALQLWQIFALLEGLTVNNLASSASVSSILSTSGPIILAFLSSFHFFKTGHSATLSSIQWDAAFIPYPTIKYPWTPLFMILNTFGPHVLCVVAATLIPLWRTLPRSKNNNAGSKESMLSEVVRSYLTHALFFQVLLLASAVFAGVLRRHLMLYRIFMPRFLLAAVVSLLVQVFGIVIGIAGYRVTVSGIVDAGFAYS